MRILITGSRDWPDEEFVWEMIDIAILHRDAFGEHDESWGRQITIVHGACPTGADAHASNYCEDHAGWWDNEGIALSEEPHPANWKDLGKRAGFVRNSHMVNLGADLCLAFIKDDSKGASHTAAFAEERGIPTRRYPM